MERGLDTPEHSQGDAAAGVQPVTASSGEGGAGSSDVAAAEESAANTVPAASGDPVAGSPTGGDIAAGTEAGVVEGGDADAMATVSSEAAESAPEAGEPTVVAVQTEADPGAVESEAAVESDGRPRKRVLTGNVVSDKSDCTIVVSIARRKKHRLYKKYLTLTKKLKAHDPDNQCRVGDLVRVVESRPLSREKRWRLVEIVKRAG
jgi:small subunit ribosomal protein S17